MLNKGIFFSSIIIFLCFNLLIHPQIFAQDKNVLAQSQYYKAEEAYKELELFMQKFRTETAKTKKKLLLAIDKNKIAKVRQSLNK